MLEREKTFCRLLFFTSLLLLLSCVPEKKVELYRKNIEEFNLRMREAQTLTRKGSYSSLKEAFQIYQELLSSPYPKIVKKNLIQTALLLCLRENELGIINNEYLFQAVELIMNDSSLSFYSPLLKLVLFRSRNLKGRFQAYPEKIWSLEGMFDWLRKNSPSLSRELKEKAEKKEFFAYMYIYLISEYDHYAKTKDNIKRFSEVYPQSSIIDYALAIYPRFNPGSLLKLIQKEPSFHEVYFFLGKKELMQGQLLSAEKKLLKAYEHFPSSVYLMESLAKVCFALEEYSESLDFHEKILEIDPDNRDALLGKAICLSYLGRNAEAIDELSVLRTRGTYLMGETYYWLAWNRKELGEFKDAWLDIGNSKKYLIGLHEVFHLAGIIAFEMGNFTESEKELTEALRLNPSNCEALYYLARIYVHQEEWSNSAIQFEKASFCWQQMEESLLKKIREVKNSSLDEKRKKRMLRKKESQLAKIRLSSATCFYNAAASYFNSGEKEKALSLASEASSHPAFRQKAEALIERIKR